MDFAQQQRNPTRHLLGITFVVLLHILVIYALVTGLARKAVEVIKKPLTATIIEEVKLPPPPPPPPPKRVIEPPKAQPVVQPYVPPPDIPPPQAPSEPVISAPSITPPAESHDCAPAPPAPPTPKPATRGDNADLGSIRSIRVKRSAQGWPGQGRRATFHRRERPGDGGGSSRPIRPEYSTKR
jgi:protein TonB